MADRVGNNVRRSPVALNRFLSVRDFVMLQNVHLVSRDGRPVPEWCLPVDVHLVGDAVSGRSCRRFGFEGRQQCQSRRVVREVIGVPGLHFEIVDNSWSEIDSQILWV